MTINDLKDQIIKKKLSNFYIFTGYELGIMNIYLKQISKTCGMPITRADSVLSVYSACTTKSMFGSKTGFYVIRNDTDFMKQEAFYENIKKDLKKNIIVLLYEKIDSRLKFGKFFKDDIIPFEQLSRSVLKAYIKKTCNMKDENVEKLIDICGGSYDLAMLECDKINTYKDSTEDRDGYTMSCDSCFDKLLKQGAIYQPEESDVFKFVDAVCSRNAKGAFEMQNLLLTSGSSSINLLGTLYNSLRTVMLIQVYNGSQGVCDVTGLDNRQVYFNKKYVGKYSTSHLVNSVKLLARTIEGIKSGWIDDKYATTYCLVNIL